MWLVHYHLMVLYVKNLLYQFSDICSGCPTKIPVFNQPESDSFRCGHYVGLNCHISCLQCFFVVVVCFFLHRFWRFNCFFAAL